MALACDKCGLAIPDGARFCPSCADPVTAADVVRARSVARERVNLVCPRCRIADLHHVDPNGGAALKCGRCGADFVSRVVQIRSKSSRGSKKFNTRDFTVRAHDLAGRDVLFEFTAPTNEDFELRSRDLAAFSFQNGRLALVQNLTLGRSLLLGVPGTGCSGPAVALLAILALVFMGFCSLVSSTGSSGPPSAPSSPDDRVSAPSPSYDVLYIHGELNLRSAPNRNAPLVRTLVRGEQVRLGPKDAKGWAPAYSVSGTQEGYVFRSSPLVRSTPPAERLPREFSGDAAASSRPRRSSSSSRGYYTGPRGGCYTYSASGRKRYVDHSYCR